MKNSLVFLLAFWCTQKVTIFVKGNMRVPAGWVSPVQDKVKGQKAKNAKSQPAGCTPPRPERLGEAGEPGTPLSDEKMNKFAKNIILACSAFVASLFMARAWVNSPSLWPPIPRSAWLAVNWLVNPIRAIEVHDQEKQIEYVMFLILSVLVMSLMSFIGWNVKKFISKKNKTGFK